MAAPRVISKTFRYENDLRWKFGRVGKIASEGKPALEISTPPELKGEAGDWTPEALFVAAANACLLLTFMAYVERERIVVTSYESTASGTVERVADKYQFTEITIRPRVELADSSFAQQVEENLRKAEKNCLIGNSISAPLRVEPHILCGAD
ncbi:MAG: OsmC family protein [Acidobacteria bacterium]|nr:OsmC family protein [Acidobacteriota bacterium]